MLTRFDDYPIHQTPDPVCQPATSDPNFYDRYWFNGFERDGGFYFGIALGVYPNRRVMDASFSLCRDGVQHALHASRLAPLDPGETRVGPMRIEVLEPMRRLRVVIEPNETGIEADLVFSARTSCIEEGRAPLRRDRKLVMDTTRFAQFGRWKGQVAAEGGRIDVRPDRVHATRDRSWGVRPVGEPDGSRPALEPQIFFLWAPLQFDDCCTHAGSFEDASGEAWDNFAHILPAYPDTAAIPGVDDPAREPLLAMRHQLKWQPGTRWMRSAEIELLRATGATETIALEPLLRFQMLGLGYLHSDWGHGRWKGDEALAGESFKLDDLDPLDLRHRHVQTVVRARWGDRSGVGVLEQLSIGPHAPYGFEHMMDGARG